MNSSNKKTTSSDNDRSSYLNEVYQIMPPLTRNRFWLYALLGMVSNVIITLLFIGLISRTDIGKSILLGQTGITFTPTSAFSTPSQQISPTETEVRTATSTPSPSETATLTLSPTSTPFPIPDCAYLNMRINFLQESLSNPYLQLPSEQCIHLQKTGNTKANGRYVEVKIWFWVNTTVLSSDALENSKDALGFLEAPGNGSSVAFNLAPDVVHTEITKEVSGDYTRMVITGWIDSSFIAPPIPSAVPSLNSSLFPSSTSTPNP